MASRVISVTYTASFPQLWLFIFQPLVSATRSMNARGPPFHPQPFLMYFYIFNQNHHEPRILPSLSLPRRRSLAHASQQLVSQF